MQFRSKARQRYKHMLHTVCTQRAARNITTSHSIARKRAFLVLTNGTKRTKEAVATACRVTFCVVQQRVDGDEHCACRTKSFDRDYKTNNKTYIHLSLSLIVTRERTRANTYVERQARLRQCDHSAQTQYAAICAHARLTLFSSCYRLYSPGDPGRQV